MSVCLAPPDARWCELLYVKMIPPGRALMAMVWLALTGLCVQAGIAAGLDESAIIEKRLGEAQSGPAASVQKRLLAGKKAAFFCANCHGESGVSTLGHVPNLAGQNPIYLLVQIQKFADGRRKDDFMSGLIKALKDEDRLGIAMYYASQAVLPNQRVGAREVQQGRQIYVRACAGCHGASARGSRNIARLAGQQPEYLVQALTDYRKRTGQRADPSMLSVASNLKDDQIAALAVYLSSMP